MFALDHIHYVRWLTVHVAELLSLEVENREIFESFVSGYFTISKSRKTFSKLAIDQAHKQNNKLVNIDGGAIGILENEATLLKRAVAEPMISDMLETAKLFENKPNKAYETIMKMQNYFKTNSIMIKRFSKKQKIWEIHFWSKNHC